MNNEGPSKKKKKIDKGLFDVQWKVAYPCLFQYNFFDV